MSSQRAPFRTRVSVAPVPWTRRDHNLVAPPDSNRYSNPVKFGGVRDCSPMYSKRLDLQKPDTRAHVRTPIIQLGVKWSQVQILSARPERGL